MMMTYHFKYTIALIIAAVSGGCIAPPDTSLENYAVAVAYQDAFLVKTGYQGDCDEYFYFTDIVFIDIAEAENECNDGEMACYRYTPISRNGFIVIPYNHMADINIVHEMTHMLLRCVYGDTDGDHSHDMWAWSVAWTDEYLANWSVIEAVSK